MKPNTATTVAGPIPSEYGQITKTAIIAAMVTVNTPTYHFMGAS